LNPEKNLIFDGQKKLLKISIYYFPWFSLSTENRPILFLTVRKKPSKIVNAYFQQSEIVQPKADHFTIVYLKFSNSQIDMPNFE
jgi:hypothetical protein